MIFRKRHNLLFYMDFLKNPEGSKDILLILTPYNFFSYQTNISILSFEPSGKIVFVYKYNNLEDFKKTRSFGIFGFFRGSIAPNLATIKV